jgi:hypothetical protein
MPWNRSTLLTAEWSDGSLFNPQVIAGAGEIGEMGEEEEEEEGEEDVSISQPRWSADGTLYFVSDQTGYYQLYRLDVGESNARPIILDGLQDAEFSMPDWFLGK